MTLTDGLNKETRFIQNLIILSDTSAKLYLTEPLRIFVSPKIAEDYYNRSGQDISEFYDTVLAARRISVYQMREGTDGTISFFGIVRGYSFPFTASSVKQDDGEPMNFSLLKVFSGKDYEYDRILSYSRPNFVISMERVPADEGLAVKFMPGGDEVYREPEHGYYFHNMSESSYYDLLKAMTAFFRRAGSIRTQQTGRRAGEAFSRNVLDYIRQYSEFEYENEVEKSNNVAPIHYESRHCLDDTAGNPIYRFISATYSQSDIVGEQEYHEGSAVAIGLERYGQQQKIMGGIAAVTASGSHGYNIDVHLWRQYNDADIPPEGNIFLSPNRTTYNVCRKVIDHIEHGTIRSQYMYGTFSDFSVQDFDEDLLAEGQAFALAESRKSAHGFQAKQIEAITKSIASRDIHMIQGPPGTGKTTVITELVKYYTGKGSRVLISSQNNAAVDNVLERVGNEEGIVALRIGNRLRVKETCRPFLPESQSGMCVNRITDSVTKEQTDISHRLQVLPKIRKQLQDASRDHLDPLISCRKQILTYQQERIIPFQKVMDEADGSRKSLRRDLEKLQNKVTEAKQYMEKYEQAGFFQKMFFDHDVNNTYREAKKIAEGTDLEALTARITDLDTVYQTAAENLNREMSAPEIRDLMKKYSALLQRAHSDIGRIECRSELGGDIRFSGDEIDEAQLEQQRDALDAAGARLDTVLESDRKIREVIADWQKYAQKNRNDAILDILLEESNVVGATCIGINSNLRYADMQFDVAILDEAGQIQVQNAIVPMTRAAKNILLGDHMQLPPVVDPKMSEKCLHSDVSDELLKKSFFEYLFTNVEQAGGGEHITRLDTQFRMPDNVASIVGRWFYAGNYHTIYNMNTWSPVLSEIHSPLVILSTSDAPMSLRNEEKILNGYQNRYEADLVTRAVRAALQGEFCQSRAGRKEPQDMIGIIAPYQQQVFAIRSALRAADMRMTDLQIDETVRTLDSFQGQERPLMIFSFVRSGNKDQIRHPEKTRIGFLKELRRLNVAFTRCTRQLLLIGDMDYLRTCLYEAVDSEGNRIPEQSEKRFAEFIDLLLKETAGGKGILMHSKDFLKEADPEETHG